MYAVIETGGKQYRVQEGDTIYIEKLDKKDGAEVSFDVLMLGGNDSTIVGSPTVKGAAVIGTIIGQVKGQKVVIYKYKAKKNYRRKAGHRQPYTKLEIKAINA